jgi:alkanesulfonate monooxygenase
MTPDLAVAAASSQNKKALALASVQVFSTCPSSLTSPERYPERVRETARWSEAVGCTGILIYTDNTLVDPWLIAQLVMQSSESLSPLVAVQPIYMHPYAAAKMIATLGFLHGRKLYLNMVAGGFKNDLTALGDETKHDQRYDRLTEYSQIIRKLCESRGPVSYRGRFFELKAAVLNPPLAPELQPGILVSGSSESGRMAAREIGAVSIEYPAPPGSPPAPVPADPYQRNPAAAPKGIRVGIIARPREEQAWDVAHARFPLDRKGQLTRQLATKVSDSAWHHRLAEFGQEYGARRETYWLHPFENYQTNCPYLVGSYEQVTDTLAGYMALGYRTFILDIQAAREEFDHIGTVFECAAGRAGL